MNNLSRHIACKLCRDRKVRCDGGQPSCEKCLRAGEKCVYVPTHKPTKADLAQTIESLQERLDKAEAYILKHGNASTETSKEHGPAAIPSSAMAVDYSDCVPLNMMMPMLPTADPFLSPGIAGMSSTSYPHRTHHSHSHSLPISPENLDNDFLMHSYLSSSHVGTAHSNPMRSHSYPQFSHNMLYHTDDITSVASTSSSSLHRSSVYSQQRHMPRNLNLNGSSTSTTSPPPSPIARAPRPDDANHILAELTAFGMVVFSTQAEIAGISSVVAEYLAWIRQGAPSSPSSGSDSSSSSDEEFIFQDSQEREQEEQSQQERQHQEGTKSSTEGLMAFAKANPAVLEALETRLREVRTLASTRHAEAWRQSIQRLERLPGMGAMLRLFDGEMKRRSGETAEFFRASYDISQPLSEQISRKD
ncbi:hypothetical protein F5Y17DRAFT_70861 [Xylariaceae sp. FL0594]|nr:hypothetical protein F5Y17DRAFT_70861 [Xylariaceae sp. FL0594]